MKPHRRNALEQTLRVTARPAFRNEDLNPYNSLLYRAVSSLGIVTVREHKFWMVPWGYDVLHLHWPEYDLFPGSARQVLKMALAWPWMLMAHIAGVKLVWTAHNAFPHDSKPVGFRMFLWKRFISTLDGVIFPSDESQRIVTAAYPSISKLPSAVIKHGHFGPWINSIRQTAKRPAPEVIFATKRLGNSFVILNFGMMRPYKNVDELMRQFSSLQESDLCLLIAGQVSNAAYLSKLEELARADRRITLLPMHLDGASLIACLDRANLVVLPFTSILNSGSALMALTLGKHVVLPAIGSMRSLQRDVGADAVTLFDGPLTTDVLRAAIDRVKSGSVARPNLREYEWPLIGAQTSDYYRRLLRHH